MIASNIGRKFLVAYNARYGTDYDAKTFFVEVFYPLFFDHPKYLMTAGNSPLENPKISWEPMIRGKKEFETHQQRNERYVRFIEKIESRDDADASIAIGFPSLDCNATTSGQVSNITMPISKEDVYLSWIGSGLGVGVKGGFCILFDNDEILMDIYDGWKLYRNAVNETAMLKGNQINSWNGQWLAHRYSRGFIPESPMANLKEYLSGKDDVMGIDTKTWTSVLVAFARNHKLPSLLGYVYNLGQMNTTIGFIPFNLDEIRRPVELYERFFGMDSGRKAEELWGTEIGFKLACQFGSMGTRAMEPKGFKDYIKNAKVPKCGKDEEQTLKFNVYKIWIMAMLNNEDLWDKSKELAQLLAEYASSGERGKKVNSNKVGTLLEDSVNKNSFIKNLTPIVKDIEEKEKLVEIAKIVNLMPSDNVPFFLTLLRFNYAANQ